MHEQRTRNERETKHEKQETKNEKRETRKDKRETRNEQQEMRNDTKLVYGVIEDNKDSRIYRHSTTTSQK